ncbi:hypothetical protein SERLA73DRAFT_167348 [Serpula lacrymans var. lacrymans S7.3]|uniref:VHS domain-containing protein n=2 Tax=Serpula lacrymans var. lacrymans TaxID=341189 RepID=F8PS42_SERL3|nr:uncharacterized protein SERLADRAFT_464433 [Serpula lacrymans var. lacrymans S7.9]EGO01224.1 hypothetical protein SERLA73DRAFT_167348 [Serpula lacrymans var. lacrymans S7.3]EGO26873.1 hypothetical protein SERLADRAFT_464433 [Serpula lacrymans var. lacrymans S7.9]
MSAIKSAISALNRDKPHSSITDWVEILTSAAYDDEAYDGIPEIVHSIELQPTGTAEASRAIRKKLKHGDAHRQYRAIVILHALVENCSHKFQSTFADPQLIDAIRHLASDHSTDARVKKKLIAVLASWQSQFKNDPSMASVSSLYRQCRPQERRLQNRPTNAEIDNLLGLQGGDLATSSDFEKRRKEKEEKELAKKKARQDKEEAKEKIRKAEKDAKRRKNRAPLNFEAEKPQILTTIANASQATNNLVNAIKLVNAEKESVATNQRVQECVANVRQARKPIVRYIQLVENEDVIGTLLETNERMITAIEMYEKLSAAPTSQDPTADMQAALAGTHIGPHRPVGASGLQDRQREAVDRAKQNYEDDEDEYGAPSPIHPDLQDLSFGALGTEQRGLPPPLLPSSSRAVSGEEEWDKNRGSLSDFSDYDSDEEPNRYTAPGPSANWSGKGKVVVNEDPFAD